MTKDVNKLLIKLSRHLCYYVYYHDTPSFITSNWLTCLLRSLVYSPTISIQCISICSFPIPYISERRREGTLDNRLCSILITIAVSINSYYMQRIINILLILSIILHPIGSFFIHIEGRYIDIFHRLNILDKDGRIT